MNDDDEYPKVVAVAIRSVTGVHTLPAPARHEDVRKLMVDELGLRHPTLRDEGFLCDDGYWYCRQDAKLFARAHNQLINDDKYPFLLSTDVW